MAIRALSSACASTAGVRSPWPGPASTPPARDHGITGAPARAPLIAVSAAVAPRPSHPGSRRFAGGSPPADGRATPPAGAAAVSADPFPALSQWVERDPDGLSAALGERLSAGQRQALVRALRRSGLAAVLGEAGAGPAAPAAAGSYEERLFQEADTDGGGADGRLSIVEFQEALRIHEEARRERTRREEEAADGGTPDALAGVPAPTGRQLLRVGVAASLPFVGFGFLDNFLMITAGEVIDETLCAALGFSTMAAAGLGNMFSDVVGLGFSDAIEARLSRVSVVDAPPLTRLQKRLKCVRYARLAGNVGGVSLGCLLGMFPLLLVSP